MFSKPGGDGLAALLLHPRMQLAPGCCGLDDDGAPVVRVGDPFDEAGVAELADDARQHGRVDAFEFGQLADPDRAATGNRAEHRELARAEADVGDRRVELAGKTADRGAQPS